MRRWVAMCVKSHTMPPDWALADVAPDVALYWAAAGRVWRHEACLGFGDSDSASPAEDDPYAANGGAAAAGSGDALYSSDLKVS